MELKDYTTEELRAELKRRNAEERANRESVLRCRMCRHWGAIDYWAIPVITWKEKLLGLASSSRPKMERVTDATMPHNSPATILKEKRNSYGKSNNV